MVVRTVYGREYVLWGRRVPDVRTPLARGAGLIIEMLLAARFEGVHRDDLIRACGYKNEWSLHGTVHWLRNVRGVAIVTRGHRCGNGRTPGRLYLAPFHLAPDDVKCGV